MDDEVEIDPFVPAQLNDLPQDADETIMCKTLN